MVRIKTNVYSHKRKKRVLKEAKGQFGDRSKRYKEAAKSLTASKQYSYFDRKKKAGDFRSLWIVRINAACRDAGLSYSRFISGLKTTNILLDRKILAEIAVAAPETFNRIIEASKGAKVASTLVLSKGAAKAKAKTEAHNEAKAKVKKAAARTHVRAAARLPKAVASKSKAKA